MARSLVNRRSIAGKSRLEVSRYLWFRRIARSVLAGHSYASGTAASVIPGVFVVFIFPQKKIDRITKFWQNALTTRTAARPCFRSLRTFMETHRQPQQRVMSAANVMLHTLEEMTADAVSEKKYVYDEKHRASSERGKYVYYEKPETCLL